MDPIGHFFGSTKIPRVSRPGINSATEELWFFPRSWHWTVGVWRWHSLHLGKNRKKSPKKRYPFREAKLTYSALKWWCPIGISFSGIFPGVYFQGRTVSFREGYSHPMYPNVSVESMIFVHRLKPENGGICFLVSFGRNSQGWWEEAPGWLAP